jgi:multiple sugar transport system permease protein
MDLALDTGQAPVAGEKRAPKNRNPRRRNPLWKEQWFGLAFVAPMFIGYCVFVLFPVLSTFVISLDQWSLISAPRFLGIKNYVKLFTADPVFFTTAGNTFYFMALLLPTNLVMTLGLASLLKANFAGVGFFRTAVFTPVVTSVVVWGILWKYIFQTDNGILNVILQSFGVKGPQWLYNIHLAIPIVVIVTQIKGLGMNTVIFIAAMQDVPSMYYEAAELEGASRWKQFTSITLPLIAPAIFLVTILTVIGSLKVFGQIYAMTEGGPGTSSYVFVYYIYQQAFRYYQFGYASAISVILFTLILLLTVAQWKLRKRWVHHEN